MARWVSWHAPRTWNAFADLAAALDSSFTFHILTFFPSNRCEQTLRPMQRRFHPPQNAARLQSFICALSTQQRHHHGAQSRSLARFPRVPLKQKRQEKNAGLSGACWTLTLNILGKCGFQLAVTVKSQTNKQKTDRGTFFGMTTYQSTGMH